MTDLPATESRSAFARRLGLTPQAVTDLGHKQRLVLTDDGKAVRVAESLALIESTRSPAHEGVRARHSAVRSSGTMTATQAGASALVEAAGSASDSDAWEEPRDPLSLRRARAQAEREEALARKALRDEQTEMGELLPREHVVALVADAATQLRTRLELLPAVLAPQLAASNDEDAVRNLLRDAIDEALGQLAHGFDKAARANA